MHSHDVLRMVVHDCVLQVEPLKVGHSRSFHFLRESKMATKLRYLACIKLYKEDLLVRSEEGDLR